MGWCVVGGMGWDWKTKEARHPKICVYLEKGTSSGRDVKTHWEVPPGLPAAWHPVCQQVAANEVDLLRYFGAFANGLTAATPSLDRAPAP